MMANPFEQFHTPSDASKNPFAQFEGLPPADQIPGVEREIPSVPMPIDVNRLTPLKTESSLDKFIISPAEVFSQQGLRQMRDELTGMVRGAGSIGSTLVELAKTGPVGLGGQPVSTLPARVEQRGGQITQALGELTGADVTGAGFTGGKVVGEIAGTMGVGPALAPVLKAFGASPAVVEMVRTGGFGKMPEGEAKKLLANILTRATGGAVGGGTAAVAVEPTPKSAGVGATVGGIIGPVGRGVTQLGGSAAAAVKPLFNPSQAAEDALYTSIGGRVDDAVAALEKTRYTPTTPGFELSLVDRLMEGGVTSPNLANLAQDVVGATPKTLQDVYDFQVRRVSALQGQLARIDERLRPAGPQLPAVEVDQLNAARQDILNALDTELNGLDIVGKAVAWRLPVGVREPGVQLRQQAQELDRLLRSTVGRPEINRAITQAGDAPVDVSGLVQRAEQILGAPLSYWKGNAAAPNVARYLNNIERAVEPPPAILGPSGEVISQQAPEYTLTLAQLDGLRQAIGSDIQQVTKGTSALAPKQAGALKSLYASTWETVDSSPALSQEVRDLYRKGTADFREILVPKIRTAETAQLIQPTTFNQTVIMPSDAVKRFIADEDAAVQFLTSFRDQPEAMLALRNGLMAQFRKEAVNETTGYVAPEAADKFLRGGNREAVFNILEQGGLGLRSGIMQIRRQAQNFADGLEEVTRVGAEFRKGTADDTIKYLLSDPSRMREGFRRMSAQGQDTVQRYLLQGFNESLNANKPQDVLNLLVNSRPAVKGAYRVALGQDVVDTMVSRAEELRDFLALRNNPVFKDFDGDRFAKWIDIKKFTPEQLTDLSLVADDIERIARTQRAATFGRAAETPDVGRLIEESAEGQGAKFQPQKIPSLTLWRSALNRAQTVLEDKLNRKARVELAAIIYNNPEAAAQALRNAATRAAPKAPSRATTAIPAAAAGAVAGPTLFQE
jgi:hypothetical protein